MLRRVVKIGAIVLATGIVLVVVFFFGMLVGEARTQHDLCREQEDAVRPILANNPAFAEVKLLGCSCGHLVLAGHVRRNRELNLLRREIAHAIGNKRANLVVEWVQVLERDGIDDF